MQKYFTTVTCAAVLAAGVFATSPSAEAAVFTLGSMNVNANTGSGLIIETAPAVSLPFSTGDLSVGQSQTFDLFRIWTPETTINPDDINVQPISLDLTFTAPAPAFGTGPLGGITGAFNFIVSFGFLEWSDPYFDIAFGANSDGVLRIALSDEQFNGGVFGNIIPGAGFGATVEATLTLIQDATPVPEPASLAVLGMGLLGLAGVARRRRA